MILSKINNVDETFILSLNESEELYYKENKLCSFIKDKNKELKIFNKDKEIILSKLKLELEGALEEYISKKPKFNINKSKNERLTKLNKIISDNNLSENISISNKEVTIQNLNSCEQVNNLFTSLLKDKDKNSSLFNVLFENKNIITKTFISKKQKILTDNIKKVFNKINRNPFFSMEDNKKNLKSYKFTIFKTESKKIDEIYVNSDCVNESNKKVTHDHYKASENNKKLKMIDEINENKKKLNDNLFTINKNILRAIACLNNLSTFIPFNPENNLSDDTHPNCKDNFSTFITDINSKSTSIFYKFIDAADSNSDSISSKFIQIASSNLDKLKIKCDEIKNDNDYSNLDIQELSSKLSDIELTIKNIDINGKNIFDFEFYKLNIIADYCDSLVLSTATEEEYQKEQDKKGKGKKDNGDFKTIFLDKINNISSQLCLYNESLEQPKSIFNKVYKFFFREKYKRKIEESKNAFNKVNMLYITLSNLFDLFSLLASGNLRKDKVPGWACKLVAKVINESMPMNDIFWRTSKEQSEWNKIYKEFIINKKVA